MPDTVETWVNPFQRLAEHEVMATVPGRMLPGLGNIKTEANRVWETLTASGENTMASVGFAIWKLAIHARDCENQPGDQAATLRSIRTLIELGREHFERQLREPTYPWPR